MAKLEKVIYAGLTIALGVLLIVLKGSVISIAMTVAGVCLLAFGVLDIYHKQTTPGIVKLVIGLLIIVCGWTILSAVLYIVGAGLIITGIIFIYERAKEKYTCKTVWQTICHYSEPAFAVLIGILLLFNQGNTVNWVFVLSGIFTIVEGGLMLVNAFKER